MQDLQDIIVSDVQKGVMTITLNRPEAFNALRTNLLKEMAETLDAAATNDDVKTVLVTGGPKVFAAGADIKEMASLDAVGVMNDPRPTYWRRIAAFPKPLVAAVNGFCLGGGCELALSCDFILASETAVFAQPEVGLGITAGFGGSQRLPQQVGKAMAAELLYTGRNVKAEEALRIGLVNHLYPQQDLLEEGIKQAHMICGKSANAVRATKELIHCSQNLPLDSGCEIERKVFGLCFGAEDQLEGMGAFLQNRSAEFE